MITKEAPRTANTEKSSDAFRLEYAPRTPQQALRRDIESYLGEYRFQIPVYNYTLLYCEGPDGQKHLRDVDQNESMIEKGQKAVKRRHAEWKSSYREEAELEGIKRLEDLLEISAAGDTIVWCSPPGQPEEGYGDYGFVYVGKIKEQGKGKQVEMSAVRVEEPTPQQFNLFLAACVDNSRNLTEKEFLESPFILPDPSLDPQLIVGEFFITQSETNMHLFEEARTLLAPKIQEFIMLQQRGAGHTVLQQAFNALENYAINVRDGKIQLRDHAVPLQELMLHHRYAQSAPMVLGSCGSSGKKSEFGLGNIFNSSSNLKDALFEEESSSFPCPKCEKPIPSGEGRTSCPHCGLTKEEHAKASGIKCD